VNKLVYIEQIKKEGEYMKKFMAIVLCIIFVLTVSACGEPKVIDGVKYDTVGLFTDKNPNIHYEVSVGNVVWSVILIESIAFPVFFIGWSIYNPACKKADYTPGVGCK
jgi:hypothetical protein